MSQPPLQPSSSSPYPQPEYPPAGTPAGPGYPPPAGGFPPPAAPAPKKSKAGKIILIVLAVIALLCVGGGTAVYFAVKDDVKEVVEAATTRVVEPETLGGKPKVADPSLVQAAAEMKTGLQPDVQGATSTVGAFYGDLEKQDLVMVVAMSGIIADPAKELDDAFGPDTGLTVTNLKEVDAGPLGGLAKCGDATADDVEFGACAWADRGSVGMIAVYFKTGAEAQADFLAYRAEIEQKS